MKNLKSKKSLTIPQDLTVIYFTITGFGISSLRGQGNFHFAKETSTGKYYRTVLKGHQGQPKTRAALPLQNRLTQQIFSVN